MAFFQALGFLIILSITRFILALLGISGPIFWSGNRMDKAYTPKNRNVQLKLREIEEKIRKIFHQFYPQETLEQLKNKVRYSENLNQRQVAFMKLANQWKKDPEILSIFRKILLGDAPDALKEIAMMELFMIVRGEPDSESRDYSYLVNQNQNELNQIWLGLYGGNQRLQNFCVYIFYLFKVYSYPVYLRFWVTKLLRTIINIFISKKR